MQAVKGFGGNSMVVASSWGWLTLQLNDGGPVVTPDSAGGVAGPPFAVALGSMIL